MIQCEHVKKEYGRKTALADFSAEFETGKIIGLLGPNGSGKTTLIKILAGLLTTEEGVVRIDKKPIGVDTKRIVSYLPERPYLSSAFRVKDIIRTFEEFYDPAARDFILKTILNNYNEEACVLISTHLISDVEKILDEVIFIKDGELVLHESVDRIREEEKKSVDALFREVFAC